MSDDSALARALTRARSAWPDLVVDEALFTDHLRARAGEGDVEQLAVGDLYLAFACARGDRKAIAAFDAQFLAEVPNILARTGATATVAQEVTQILRARLLVADDRAPRIADYAGRGSLAGWIRIAAVRAASNLRRGERARAPREEPIDALPAEDPEIRIVKEKYGALFNEAFRAGFQALAAEERLTLRLHFVEGLNLDQLAEVFHVSRATAGRRVMAARARLRDETMRLLGERIQATPTELESLLAAIRSQLDVSLGALVTSAEE